MMQDVQPLHIAVGVIVGADGRILISQRRADCAYAGQWEFPGGKLEAGEGVEAALRRELREELGIEVCAARPLIRIEHHYPDRHVLLNTWQVTQFEGSASGREGQRINWVTPAQLDSLPMLAANRPIVRAAQLPAHYLITPEPGDDWAAFLQPLNQALTAGIRLMRLRANQLDDAVYAQLARKVLQVCQPHGAGLLLDRDAAMVERLGAAGLHLRASALQRGQLDRAFAGLLAASCHTAEELQLAHTAGADFAVLGPVAATPSHPGAPVLGWNHFAELTATAKLPVYALGGLSVPATTTAWRHGAQGIAAIRAFWPSAEASG